MHVVGEADKPRAPWGEGLPHVLPWRSPGLRRLWFEPETSLRAVVALGTARKRSSLGSSQGLGYRVRSVFPLMAVLVPTALLLHFVVEPVPSVKALLLPVGQNLLQGALRHGLLS